MLDQIQPADCCQPCSSQTTTQVPGPQGPNGAAGNNGTNGTNSYTTTTAQFTMPNSGSSQSVSCTDSSWMVVNEWFFVGTAGLMQLTAINSPGSITLLNGGYTGNAAGGTSIPNGSKITPSGPQGPTGATGVSSLNSVSPTTTKGDIIVDNGNNNPSASCQRLGVGTDGQMISADSGQSAGIKWSTILPNTAGSRNIPVAGATTGKPIGYIDSPMAVSSTGALQNSNGSFNGRGTSAVDLQPVRASNAEVASGNNSVIAGGQNNTAAGSNSAVSGGSTNTASGTGDNVTGGTSNGASGGPSTVTGGTGNTASGQYSIVLGGNTNTASGTGAVASGANSTASGNYSKAEGNGATAPLYGQAAKASGTIANPGDAQSFEVIMRQTTTNATPALMYLDGSSAKLVIPVGTTWAFEGVMVRRVQSSGASRAWQFSGAIKNTAGTVAIVGSSPSQVDLGHDDTNASFAVSAGTTDLTITVTGFAATNYAWVARVRCVQVTY